MQVIWKKSHGIWGFFPLKKGKHIPHFREISLGWQKLGVDTRTAWVVGGGRILSHREGQELIVRDFRRWKEQQD